MYCTYGTQHLLSFPAHSLFTGAISSDSLGKITLFRLVQRAGDPDDLVGVFHASP